ncbi:MAG: CUB domain-containing protein [Candidatus Heimdallarchaeaceae archaeon]
MKLEKKIFIGMLIVALAISIYPAFVSHAEGQGDQLFGPSNARAVTQESYILESDHPYSNYFDYTWTITKPGASYIKVHFTYIEVETNYDYLYVYDYAGTVLHKLTGTYSSGGWTAASNGDTIKIRLVTDYSVTKWGFKIDLIEYDIATTTYPSLTNGETVTSSLSATGDSETWTIDVGPDALSMHSVLNCGTNDYDLYGRLGAPPTTSTYDWRGYTYGGEDVTFDYPGEGTWYIMVHSYSGSGAYDLTVTITYDNTSPPPSGGDGVTNYYAVIVGISDYTAISDLSYCDEDATDWYYQLVNNLGWSSTNVKVYGDTHTANYPKYDGDATEYNVKQALNWLITTADADDVIAFISSGHGSGDGYGSSYLCMLDCSAGVNGEDGSLYDTEVAAIFQSAVASKIFIFFDHCYSGGFGDDILGMPNADKVYLTTTCTENGYGYDDSTHQNGAWTYYFLDYSWQQNYGGSATVALETIFSYALNAYPYSGGDTPQQFDGNTAAYFYLN